MSQQSEFLFRFPEAGECHPAQKKWMNGVPHIPPQFKHHPPQHFGYDWRKVLESMVLQ